MWAIERGQQRRALATLAASCLACAAPATSPTPTWHDEVAPLVAAHCMPCHEAGGQAPLAFDSYGAAVGFSDLMAHATTQKLMPPWAADDEACAHSPDFRGDLRLSFEQIETISRWAEEGAPRGEVRPFPAARELPSFDLDLELPLRTPFEFDGHADRLMCQIFDPQLSEAAWVQGFDFVAGSTRAVHHVNLFVDLGNSSAALDPDDDGWFGCFSWPEELVGYQAGSLLPGSDALVLPDEVGMYLPPGAKIIAQIHYEATGVPEIDDASALRLDWADATPSYVAAVAVVGNHAEALEGGLGLLPDPLDPSDLEFFIPAGSRAHTEGQRTRVEGGAAAHVWSLTNHMHYAGTRMTLGVERADGGAASCWLDTPRWDFDWQRSYVLAGPVDQMPLLGPGDVLTQTCTYDNSADNARLMQGLQEAGAEPVPRDIELGETSLDEMCLSFIGLAVPI